MAQSVGPAMTEEEELKVEPMMTALEAADEGCDLNTGSALAGVTVTT